MDENEHVRIKNERTRAFFAAANSGEGFKSFYREIFSPEKLLRRYLIKGGAGSGKSTLMRRVAEYASEHGHRVEYYYCSSDYTSLDGIVIDGRVSLVDSTAPHILEPELAGATDEIVDTGLFWDSRVLSAQKERIAELSARKGECYRGAYRYLEAALALDRRSRELMHRYVKSDKLPVVIKNGDEKIETGRKKVGAMLGDFVEVGCNSVLNPGTVIGRNSNVYPTSCVRGVIPENSIYKDQGNIVIKKK